MAATESSTSSTEPVRLMCRECGAVHRVKKFSTTKEYTCKRCGADDLMPLSPEPDDVNSATASSAAEPADSAADEDTSPADPAASPSVDSSAPVAADGTPPPAPDELTQAFEPKTNPPRSPRPQDAPPALVDADALTEKLRVEVANMLSVVQEGVSADSLDKTLRSTLTVYASTQREDMEQQLDQTVQRIQEHVAEAVGRAEDETRNAVAGVAEQLHENIQRDLGEGFNGSQEAVRTALSEAIASAAKAQQESFTALLQRELESVQDATGEALSAQETQVRDMLAQALGKTFEDRILERVQQHFDEALGNNVGTVLESRMQDLPVLIEEQVTKPLARNLAEQVPAMLDAFQGDAFGKRIRTEMKRAQAPVLEELEISRNGIPWWTLPAALLPSFALIGVLILLMIQLDGYEARLDNKQKQVEKKNEAVMELSKLTHDRLEQMDAWSKHQEALMKGRVQDLETKLVETQGELAEMERAARQFMEAAERAEAYRLILKSYGHKFDDEGAANPSEQP